MNARRRLLPVAALALVAPALSSCQLLGGGSSLDDALEVVPGDATQITFVDRKAAAERNDVGDVESGADDDEVADYLEALQDDPVGSTPLATYLSVMDDAAFSELDVVWWIQSSGDDGPITNVYKVEDADLDQLVDDLEGAGFDAEEEDGRTILTSQDPASATSQDGLIADAYPIDFGFGTLVDPDENLVVTGGDVEQVADVLADDEDSLTDTGTFDDLLDGEDDAELAVLAQDPPCGNPRATPESVEKAGIGDLGTPEALGYFAGDDTTTARLLFDDDEAAEADAEARTTYLEDGLSVVNQQPVSDLGTAEVEQDGDVVTMQIDLEKPQIGRQLVMLSDAFFACPPR